MRRRTLRPGALFPRSKRGPDTTLRLRRSVSSSTLFRVWTTVALAAIGFGAAPHAVPQAPPDTTITIRATGSTLDFQPPRVSVKSGRRVTLRFINDGTLPHNVVLPRDAERIDALVSAAYGAGETGYVPLANTDDLLAHTPLASPGDTVEATFVVPPPGEYTYICLVPGHATSMFGTLRSLR